MEPVSFRKYFGEALEEARSHADLSRLAIAEVLGVDEATVWRWENGKNWPEDPDVVAAIYSREGQPSVLDLWTKALDDAREADAKGQLASFLSRDFPTVAELHERRVAKAVEALPDEGRGKRGAE
ncbi:MAG TPA: helix-turn-helix transcriptional regulator [Solirubrobacterales bacterium]|nr:helix-turn-helix transcriptional regulator [Solirubrobacterales bacterium]